MKQKKFIQVVVPLAVAGTAFGVTGVANAAGFALLEQSVKQVGNAISGGAASNEDASTIFFNPAGMTRLRGSHLALQGHIVSPSASFSGSANTNPLLGGAPINGGDGGEAGGSALVPSFFYTHELKENLWVGVGVGAPFGLATEYDSNWVGRYHAINSEVMTFNINPSVAYKVNDKLSLGAGLNIMQATAELSNAVDYSAVCLSSQPLATCAALGLATPGTAATDGDVHIEGDGWGYGINLGLLYEVSPQTRIGAAYRSTVKQETEGDADFTAPTGPIIPAPIAAVLADTDTTAAVDLPASLSLSVATEVAPKWELMADITWTQWSSFEELRIEFDNPLKADSVQPENWDDTFKFSLGFNYRHSADWTFRGGIAYDQSPVPGIEYRTPRIPGNDRKWLAGGFTYTASPTMTLDFALAHLFVSDTDIDAADESFGHQLTGTYEADANILAFQANWNF
ncbi:MAG: outer membrane protein transport protein [Candidatus Thiodiazotropha sp.]